MEYVQPSIDERMFASENVFQEHFAGSNSIICDT